MIGWLVPGALALAALGALPLLAHLARQTPRERQPFGAMLLLERVVERLRRRRRVKDPWLLVLRLLAVLLLTLAATGLRWSLAGLPPDLGGSGRVVLLVDQSMSMSLEDGGSSLLSRAREEAVAVLRGLPEGARVGVVAFGDRAVRLTPELTTERELLAARVAELQPTWQGSNLRDAVLAARHLLEGEPGEVILFSDQAGPRMVPEARVEIERLVAQGSAVLPRTIRGNPPRNVAVSGARYGEGIEGGQVALRLTNYGPDPIEIPCEVVLPDGAAIPVFVDLPPEGEAEARVTVPAEARGGVGRVRCEDPDLPADDSRYFHLPRVGASRVLVVDGDPGDTPIRSEVYFLERALAPWGGARDGVLPDVVPPVGLLALDPEVHRVVFLANVADPRPYGPLLTEFVRKGGNLVVSGGDNVTPERYEAALGSILPSPIRKVRSLASAEEDGVPLALPELGHGLLEPFSRAGRAGFARVRSHRVLTLDPYDESDTVRTILRYEGGVPALVERRVGQGRVLLWTSTFDLGWTNLPLQAVYMPLLQRTVAWLGGESGANTARFDAVVGETVAIPLPDLSIEPSVLGPDGSPHRSRIEGSRLLFTPDRPGAYEIHLDSAPPLGWVAVNTHPVESDVRALHDVVRVQQEIAPERFLTHVDLTPGLLAGALLAFLLQALVALRGTFT